MSSDEDSRSARFIDWLARHRLRWLGVGIGLAAVLVLFNGWVFSPARLPSTASKVRPTTAGPEIEPEQIGQLLRKGNDLTACRTVVRQFQQVRTAAPLAGTLLSEDDLRWLRQECQLDEDELNEVASPAGTALDAHHLESCLLFADAARALQVAGQSERAQASAAFAWVIRQVRLQDSAEVQGPPSAVLRRGWGSESERALVFLALVEQLGLPGCMLVVPGSGGMKPWLPGVLADGEILLFDTRLGVPLPGAEEREVATLGHLRSRPELFKALSAWNYDVTPEQAAQAEVRVACVLSALAPRQRGLEQALNRTQTVRLTVAPQPLLENYRQAAQRAGLAAASVRCWSNRDEATPLRAQRTFLPPGEGGSDRSRERQPRFNGSVVPWSALPAAVEAVPAEVELGSRLRDQFARPFLDFTLNPHLPRDLMLRGRLEDAVSLFVETIDRVGEQQRVLKARPEFQDEFLSWLRTARLAQEDWLLARNRAATARTPEAQAAVTAAETRFLEAWRQGERQLEKDGQPIGPAPLEYLHGRAGAVLSVEAAYLLALAKQEQAEALAMRTPVDKIDPEAVQAAWRAAADRWQKYRADYPAAPAAPAAALGLARCLEALGDRAAARMALEGLPATQRGWTKAALELRLREVQSR